MNRKIIYIALTRSMLIAVLSFGAVHAVLAQEDTNEPVQQDAKSQEKIKNLRIAYISEKLGLTASQAEKFWPIYHDFVKERSKLRSELKDINVNAGTPDPKKQQEMVDLGLRVKQRELDLEKDYSGRLLKVINAQQMLNLHKAEREFRTMVINTLQQRRMMQERKENFRDKNQLLRERNK